MVRSCCAVGCTVRDTIENRKKGISFYRIPAEGNKRQQWLMAIKRAGFQPSPHTVICSLHFVGGKLLLNCD